MTIPPSPPGTPPPTAAALTAKFDNFLELKRTKGVHFNARLASSMALRNPALMDKLLGFAGIDSLAGQYETTLTGEECGWDARTLPEWAGRDALRKSQERMSKERERGRGEPLEFVVPASSAGDAAAGAAGNGGKKKTRFDN
jgi:hypothetical protein